MRMTGLRMPVSDKRISPMRGGICRCDCVMMQCDTEGIGVIPASAGGCDVGRMTTKWSAHNRLRRSAARKEP